MSPKRPPVSLEDDGFELPFSQLSLTVQDTVGGLDSRIASFLGDNMPVSSGSSIPNEWTTHFVSLRLLLLTPVAQRTAEEKYHTYMIRKSYSHYNKKARYPSQMTKTSNQDLASLLVQDWQRLLKSAPTTIGAKAGNFGNHVAL